MKKKPETNEQSTWRIKSWFDQLDEEQLKKLSAVNFELGRFNEKVNLVSERSLINADNDHFADCIAAFKLICGKGFTGRCFDIGSGNGFPGLIFAILDPKLKMVLVDRDGRKCEYLKFVATSLNLTNVEVLNKGVETLPADSIDLGVSRGFAPLAKGLLATRKVFKVGGRYFHMKGPSWITELGSLPAQICSVWKTEHVGDYNLPLRNSSEKLSIIMTTKVAG